MTNLQQNNKNYTVINLTRISNLASRSKLPNHNKGDSTKFILNRSFPNSFLLRSILEQEVNDQIMNLKTLTKSTIGVPIKCIKLPRKKRC